MVQFLVRQGSSLFGAAILVLALALPALAGDGPTIQPDDSTVVPGQDVTITGDGFVPGEEVQILVGSGSCEAVVVGTVTADGSGGIESTFTMPADVGGCTVTPGPWQVVATTGDSGSGAEYDVLVAAPGTGGGGETQPATDAAPRPAPHGGSTSAFLLLVGLITLAAAGLGMFPARRRR